jgi:hypothetical protein
MFYNSFTIILKSVIIFAKIISLWDKNIQLPYVRPLAEFWIC